MSTWMRLNIEHLLMVPELLQGQKGGVYIEGNGNNLHISLGEYAPAFQADAFPQGHGQSSGNCVER